MAEKIDEVYNFKQNEIKVEQLEKNNQELNNIIKE